MKKVLSVVAMALMLIGLAGCMDSQDGANQSTKDNPAGDTKHVSKNN